MLQIQTTPREPVRVELPGGGYILFKPASTTGKAVARAAAGQAFASGEGVDVAGVAFTVALAAWGALSWEGVADQDGQSLAVTSENVALLLEQRPDVYEAVNARYAVAVLALDAEKNGSAPAPDGTSPASRRTTAPTARAAKARADRGAAATIAPRARKAARAAPTS